MAQSNPLSYTLLDWYPSTSIMHLIATKFLGKIPVSTKGYQTRSSANRVLLSRFRFQFPNASPVSTEGGPVLNNTDFQLSDQRSKSQRRQIRSHTIYCFFWEGAQKKYWYHMSLKHSEESNPGPTYDSQWFDPLTYLHLVMLDGLVRCISTSSIHRWG